MTTKEAEVFHKLRVATPLSTRGGHPVSVVFNGISANAWLSPIGISHGKQQKDARDERYIAQRPHTAGSIAVVRHHPKPSGLQKSEILTGRQLPVNANKSTCCHDDQTGFRRPLAFEDDYTSPIGSHMYNQKVIKKGYRGGGFCDGPTKRQRPHTSIPQMRITKETPVTLELTVKSLELNRGSSEKGSCHVLYDDDMSKHQLLNVNAYEDLRKSCIQRAKSAPAGSRPTGGSKSPSLYWRARSAYHRKLMTPTPDPQTDGGEDTQVVRGSMLRPLMYNSITDIQHSAGCPYKCKGCFKACLVSQDYLEKSKRRRLPVRVRRDLRQRSMMKKDPRYILHQALARNQPIYKLVHGLCDERTVRKAWDDGRTVRGRDEYGISPSDECSLVGEPDESVTVGETEVVQSEAKSRELSSENTGSVGEVSEVVIETQKDQRQNTIAIDNVSNLLNNRKILVGTDRRVKSAEHRKLERPVDLKDRPKSCSPGQVKDIKPFKSEFPKGFKPDKGNVFISGEKRELKRGNALDLADSETDRRREDSTDDGRGSISTVTPAIPSTVGDSTEAESVSPSEHNKHSKSRKGRKGKKLRKARKQESSSDESCSGSEERSTGSDSTVENTRNRRKSKRENRRDKKYPDDSANSGTSDTLTEQSASGLSETSENGRYSSSETDCSDVNSDVDNETTDSDKSELISPKEETKKRKTKETRKSMMRSGKYTHDASDDKTVEELTDGTRTPRTLDCAASEIQSGTESELQFDTASRDSGSIKGSVRSSSSSSGRCTTSCGSVKDSVTVKSERSSTKVSSRSSVRSSDKSIRRSDLSRGTSEPSSDRTVDNKSSDKDSLYSNSKINPTSSINASSCSKDKKSDRLGRSKGKKSGRSLTKPTRQKSRFRSDSSSDDAESAEDSSAEEHSDSSTQSGSSDEECVKVSQQISKKKEVKKSKFGRNMKVKPARSKKKGTFENVNVKRNSSDKSKVVVEAKTMDREDAYEMKNDCFDDVKSENIPIILSDDNHETKKKLYRRKKTKPNSRMESKVRGRKIQSKNKCDDNDDDSDDKSSCDDTSDEEEGDGDNKGKTESDDDKGKIESDDNKGKTESDDDKGKTESDDDDKGKTESDDDKGKTESDDDDKGKTESDDDDQGEPESDDDDKRKTLSDDDDNVKRVAERKDGKRNSGKFQDIHKSKTKTPKQRLRKDKKCSKQKHKNRKRLKGKKQRKVTGSDSESCSDDDTNKVCSDSDDTNKEVSEATEGDTDSECRERNKTKSKNSMDKRGNKVEYSSEEQMSDKEESDKTDSDGRVSDKSKDSDSSGETESSSDEEEESDDSDDDDDADDSD